MKTFKNNLYDILSKQKLNNYNELGNTKNEYAITSSGFQYFIIMLKCLKYRDNSGLSINKDRLDDELKLWKYYNNGVTETNVMHFYGILSFGIVNSKLEDLNESIKDYVEYFSINIELIPEIFYLAYLISEIIICENVDEIIENAKRNFIEFSYFDVFKPDDKSKIISFEKNRIKLISDLHIKKYVDYALISFFYETFLLNSNETNNNNQVLFNLIDNSYNYLLGLRKGQIKTLIYKKNGEKLLNKPEGSIISHDNFSKSEILKLVRLGSQKIVIVNTKFGCLRLVN